MEQVAGVHVERDSEAPAEDIPAGTPAPADPDALPGSPQTTVEEPQSTHGAQHEAGQGVGEAPAQPQSAPADIQEGAQAPAEHGPVSNKIAEGTAVQQAGGEAARQQTGAGRKKKGVVLMKQKKLRHSEVEALAERLSKSRPLPPPEKRTRAVRLTYAHDKKSKKYLPKLVPAKKTTAEEQTSYMVSLAARCAESEERKQRMLEAKYLQPLTKPKKIRKKSMEAHIAKMEKLYQGQPTG